LLLIFHRRARKSGIRGADRWGFFMAMLVFGLLGAALLKTIILDPGIFFRHSFAALWRFHGIASMGGLAGGLLGGLLFCSLRGNSRTRIFVMLDAMAYAAPSACLVARLGCALAHEHLGLYTASWLGVPFREGTRYDLGLVEFLSLIPLSVSFWWLGLKRRPNGFFFALFGCIYGGFRLWLDTLGEQPYRFIGASIMITTGIAGWLLAGRTGSQLANRNDAESTPQFT
jgi:phosphatidylglycerol:prolipoprotein diacylglycerol transferase